MSGTPDEPSPWSSDGVPVSADPPAVVWDDVATSVGQPTRAPADTSSSMKDPGRVGSRQPVVIGLLAVLALVVVGLVAWPGGSSDDADDANEDIADDDIPASSLDTLPDRADGEALDDPEPARPAVADPATGTGASGRMVEQIDLPDPVAASSEPTELVMQTTEGLIHTVSLPSGSVRSVDLGITTGVQGYGGGNLIAGPDASLVSSYGTQPHIVPRSGVPFQIDRAQFGDGPAIEQINPYGWITDTTGETLFVVSKYDSSNDSEQSFLVATDGVAAELSDAASGFSFPIAAQGVLIVNDAGGAYRLDPDGATQRMTDGTVLGASRTDLLIRRCDETRDCRFYVRPIGAADDSPQAREIDLSDSVGNRSFGISLSPDGTAVALTRYGQNPRRIIVDLADGATVEGDSSEFGAGGAWARDGSGEFTSAPGAGISFLDRATGDSFVFGEDLGQISAIAARYPDDELDPPSIPSSPIAFSTVPQGEVGVDLLTIGRIGAVTLVDLDAATASSWNTPSVPGGGPVHIFADDTEATVLSANLRSGFSTTYGTADELAPEALPSGPVFAGPDGGHWARSVSATAAVDQTVTTIGDEPTTPVDATRLVVDNATLLGDDGAGSLVFDRGGSVYTSSGGEPTLLTTGELVALGSGTALVRDCDPRLSCTLAVFDRVTGESAATGADSILDLAHGVGVERGVALAGTMSPDGDVALVSFPDPTSLDDDDADEMWAIIDLVTSNAVTVDRPTDSQPIVWNVDSTYAVFASGGSIRIYERSTQSIIDVTGITDVRGIAQIGPDFDGSASATE